MKKSTFVLVIMFLSSCLRGFSEDYVISNLLPQKIIESLPEWKEMPTGSFRSKFKLPNQTIYELVSTEDNLGYSCAIADIIESRPHYHKQTAETYVMLTGILEVTVDDKQYVLHPGDVLAIPLNGVHFARSLSDKPARLLVSCVPGWTAEDHIFVEE